MLEILIGLLHKEVECQLSFWHQKLLVQSEVINIVKAIKLKWLMSLYVCTSEKYSHYSVIQKVYIEYCIDSKFWLFRCTEDS